MIHRPGSFRIDFVPPAAKFSRGVVVALAVGFLMLTMTVWAWWHFDNLLRAEQVTSLRTAHLKPQATQMPTLSEKEKDALRREIAAVNRPIRQLNQSWDGLLSDIRAKPDGGIRVLSIGVDGRSNAVRIVGVATNVAAMADYADILASRRSLGNVALVRHEKSRSEIGLKFTVEAQWTARG